MTLIGFATIGESPRDDVVPAILQLIGPDVRAVECGCLDRLTRSEVDTLRPGSGEVGIVTLLKNGDFVLLSHSRILPRMQTCVDQLVNDEGAELVVILCGADWSAVQCDRLVVNPGRLFPATIGALAHGRKLGIIKPSAGQVEQERARYAGIGIDAVVTSASPYAGEDRLALARAAAEKLASENCDLIWMTCIGMDVEMRNVVTEVSRKPVMLAQALIARIVSELIPQSTATGN